MRALLWSSKDLDRSVVAHLGEHPDAEVFTSLPRSGQVNAAQLLAAWGDCRQAYPQADSVATLGACARSPTPPAATATSASGGPATSGCGRP
jgi:transposase